MIIYIKEKHAIERKLLSLDQPMPNNLIWIDLVNISAEEEQKLEQHFNIDIPTAEETKGIAVSHRLYERYGATFMTITLCLSQENDLSNLKPYNITFILIKDTLITIRDINSNLFDDLIPLIESKQRASENICFSLLLALLEKIINQTSEFLENIGHHLDGQTDILTPFTDIKISCKVILKDITNIGHSVSKTRESLITFNRMLTFLSQLDLVNHDKIFLDHIKVVLKDLDALSGHATFLAGKINFLLDITLGLINIEQNNIIKIFSVVSVIFMPPTLIASIYGMNFDIIPELKWAGGYPFAVIMMLISSWIPYRYFKKKEWL